MPTRTKPAWYAHCWIFCLSQFGKPTTGSGVKPGMPTAQLIQAWQFHSLYTCNLRHSGHVTNVEQYTVQYRHLVVIYN